MKSRTYVVPHAGNDAKLRLLWDMLAPWRSALVTVQMIQVAKLRNGERIGWLTAEETSLLGDNPLSARQVKSVTNQVNGALRSWQATAIAEGRKLLRQDNSLNPETAQQVRLLNGYADWWNRSGTVIVGSGSARKTLPVSQESRDYARALIAKILSRNRFPVLGAVRTMSWDTPVARVEQSRDSSFDRWLVASTLQRGKPVRIPLRSNPYLDSRAGEQAGVTQVHIAEDGTVKFSRVWQSEAEPPRADGRIIGVDWGMKCLLTTSDGDRLGQQMFTRLSKLDGHITGLEAELSRRGIRFRNSKRWRNLTRRMRESVRNEIGRVVNSLLRDSSVREIAVESLDFRFGGLSRRMNRLLNKMGRSALRAKLARATEDTGVTVSEVNPAYTSQQCSGCGFVHRLNRTSQSRFRCRFCDKTSHADVNASRNIALRRSQGSTELWHSPSQVHSCLDERFAQRWGIRFAEVTVRHSRGHSSASSLPPIAV